MAAGVDGKTENDETRWEKEIADTDETPMANRLKNFWGLHILIGKITFKRLFHGPKWLSNIRKRFGLMSFLTKIGLWTIGDKKYSTIMMIPIRCVCIYINMYIYIYTLVNCTLHIIQLLFCFIGLYRKWMVVFCGKCRLLSLRMIRLLPRSYNLGTWESYGWLVKNELFVTRIMIEHNTRVSKNSGTPKWMVYNGKPY